ncbi:NAD(P)-binding protein [Lindgomyces ingoldianus]|uniref:NAD(P)-binding protein n=1 Tax=Lindgomyces ingoldianus TaxID=673940 RepID=A0ACB6QG92_9PLEO|nr:NAD(P)-binding protein [Lindgomyces ingoldianus]KAF2465946.1 NAD(P)-binding protein [Lindgomyces ingoldianus]
MPLTGTALVVGGGSGIGQETAFAFAEAGCKAVAIADINENNAQKAAEQSKEYAVNPAYQSFSIKVDVVDEDSVQNMVDIAVKALGGRIDYFVNCAGAPNMSSFPISDLNTKHFDRVVRINLYGTVNCMKAVSKAMQSQEPTSFIPETRRTSRHPERLLGRGSIVNLGSVNSIMANAGNMSYVTAKHAIVAATKVAALDLAKDLIRVNVVLPGGTDTPMLTSTIDRLPHFRQLLIDRTPLHRLASTDEIANTIVHICSPGASYMTGATVVIDGGLSLSAARL